MTRSRCSNAGTTNQKDGIQAVLVLGKFSGGEVCLDYAGRDKCGGESKSLGLESDVIVVPNKHGTLFIGSYKSIWHSVQEVTSGTRTIIAAYAREDVAVFDRTIRNIYTPKEAIAMKDERVKILRATPDKCDKAALKAAWKSCDLLN